MSSLHSSRVSITFGRRSLIGVFRSFPSPILFLSFISETRRSSYIVSIKGNTALNDAKVYCVCQSNSFGGRLLFFIWNSCSNCTVGDSFLTSYSTALLMLLLLFVSFRRVDLCKRVSLRVYIVLWRLDYRPDSAWSKICLFSARDSNSGFQCSAWSKKEGFQSWLGGWSCSGAVWVFLLDFGLSVRIFLTVTLLFSR